MLDKAENRTADKKQIERDYYDAWKLKFLKGKLPSLLEAYENEGNRTNAANQAFTIANIMQLKCPAFYSITDIKNTLKKTTPPKPKKEKTPALELPVDKVHFHAKVKQFALMWNNFNEQNEEVVVLEELIIQGETAIPIGLSWCSHSKTLKKLELQVGDVLEFDGKIVKKTLAKGKDVEDNTFIVNEKVLYKINNPSKLKKN